jgi:4-hydroxybenzoate polyprenyltransferase
MSIPGNARLERHGQPPLVVDMDGTLIQTDSLLEGAFQLWKIDPLLPFKALWWLLRRGKVGLKRAIADRVELDAAFLPYNERLIARLKEQHALREILLCTAADRRFAEAVAKHVGLFDGVIATSGEVNLRSAAKANALVERYGTGGFDYAGDDAADLKVFAVARRALVVSPTAGLRRRIGKIANREILDDSPPRFALRDAFRALRPYQWTKNLLVYVALLPTISPERMNWLIPATLAFVCFNLVGSCAYLVNDLLDLPADRRHPRKRRRPIAAGLLPLEYVVKISLALLVAGFAIAARISVVFTGILFVYLAGSLLYTLWLKRIPLLDTFVLAGLYTIRILAGAAAINVEPSLWLVSFSMFFFLSLALAKRYSELVEMQGASRSGGIPGRGYIAEDLNTLISQGSASGYTAALVLVLYINSPTVREQYRHPEMIWLICPLILYWINKLWLNAARHQIKEDPVVWALRNRVSRAAVALCIILLLMARLLP